MPRGFAVGNKFPGIAMKSNWVYESGQLRLLSRFGEVVEIPAGPGLNTRVFEAVVNSRPGLIVGITFNQPARVAICYTYRSRKSGPQDVRTHGNMESALRYALPRSREVFIKPPVGAQLGIRIELRVQNPDLRQVAYFGIGGNEFSRSDPKSLAVAFSFLDCVMPAEELLSWMSTADRVVRDLLRARRLAITDLRYSQE